MNDIVCVSVGLALGGWVPKNFSTSRAHIGCEFRLRRNTRYTAANRFPRCCARRRRSASRRGASTAKVACIQSVLRNVRPRPRAETRRQRSTQTLHVFFAAYLQERTSSSRGKHTLLIAIIFFSRRKMSAKTSFHRPYRSK